MLPSKKTSSLQCLALIFEHRYSVCHENKLTWLFAADSFAHLKESGKAGFKYGKAERGGELGLGGFL